MVLSCFNENVGIVTCAGAQTQRTTGATGRRGVRKSFVDLAESGRRACTSAPFHSRDHLLDYHTTCLVFIVEESYNGLAFLAAIGPRPSAYCSLVDLNTRTCTVQMVAPTYTNDSRQNTFQRRRRLVYHLMHLDDKRTQLSKVCSSALLLVAMIRGDLPRFQRGYNEIKRKDMKLKYSKVWSVQVAVELKVHDLICASRVIEPATTACRPLGAPEHLMTINTYKHVHNADDPDSGELTHSISVSATIAQIADGPRRGAIRIKSEAALATANRVDAPGPTGLRPQTTSTEPTPAHPLLSRLRE
ncbi:hypothetical protein EVAR_98550_1 [Eumeta japonica]|uniref:Uncharacterized protein n=1 Tax=Eumeta variegata TaxID=151549 RepID=A0A4C1YKV5_EUMVA|nr:hypothetical protein EVAR_98550_1 [Eumeta japonica]